MKRIFLLVIAIFAFTFGAMALDKYSTNRSDLPEPARQFLTQHFPKAKVGMIKTDKHLLKKTDYDVKLVDGTKIEFNNKGNWTSVDCKKKAVPSSIIPKSISQYVKKNFSGVEIVKIEKKTTEYEVELSDDVELKFNLFGQFKSMKLDD